MEENEGNVSFWTAAISVGDLNNLLFCFSSRDHDCTLECAKVSAVYVPEAQIRLGFEMLLVFKCGILICVERLTIFDISWVHHQQEFCGSESMMSVLP